MPDPTRPFWIDWSYDRDNADTGTTSRYGNYLLQDARLFKGIAGDYDEVAVPFAAAAWRIATGPVMSPPLVRCHERILGTSVQRNGWDGGMIACVRLATPLPAALAGARSADGGWYSGYGSTWGRFDGPGEEDLTKRSYLLAETQVAWHLSTGAFPVIHNVPADSGSIFRLAVKCLEALVAGLNREVGPLLERLER